MTMWFDADGNRSPITCSGGVHRFGLVRNWETRMVEHACACGSVSASAEHVASDFVSDDRWLVEVSWTAPEPAP